ncbi:MAG: pyridoxal phosphate-dependent aminotransferase [bacterium]|nr:pyridoxal phosphate-dependent aminotransferase [bacterium]
MLANRIKQLLPSPTIALDTRAKLMQSEGINVINLTAGEPNFSTPENICRAGKKAIDDGYTHYLPNAGIEKLRIAIVKKLKLDNGIEYTQNEIVVGVGTKQILYSAFQVLCEDGDEVIVPTPTWSTYIEQIKLAGGKPIIVNLSPPFKLRATDLEKHLTKKTKIIVLNSPCNPTGAVIERNELVKIVRLAIKNKIYIISDEIYEKIIYQKKHYSIASLSPEAKNYVITVNGFSKSHAMTGWRVGYAAGPKEIIQAMVTLATQTTSGTSSISQLAAVEALNGSQKSVLKMVREFKKRRDFFYKNLKKIKDLKIVKPEGAFYLFLDIKKFLGSKYETATAWTEALLANENVAVVPGEAFYAPGYIRISYATDLKTLTAGIKKIQKFINSNL